MLRAGAGDVARIALVALASLFGCAPSGQDTPAEASARAEVSAAMERYQRVSRLVNAGSTAALYTATADSIEVHGGMALYWGAYFERLAFPGQPLSEQHGKFVAQWVRQADGQWMVHRMYRIPLPERRAR